MCIKTGLDSPVTEENADKKQGRQEESIYERREWQKSSWKEKHN